MPRKKNVSYEKKDPFNYDQISSLTISIKTLYNRMDYANPFPLDQDETLRLICTPEDYEIIKQANEIVTIPSRYVVDRGIKVTTDFAQLDINLNSKSLYPSRLAVILSQPELLQRVHIWYKRYEEVSRTFGLALNLLRLLNQLCSNVNEIRYIWSPIVSLCLMSGDDKLQKIGANIQNFSPVSNAPSLPLGVRQAVRETSSFRRSDWRNRA